MSSGDQCNSLAPFVAHALILKVLNGTTLLDLFGDAKALIKLHGTTFLQQVSSWLALFCQLVSQPFLLLPAAFPPFSSPRLCPLPSPSALAKGKHASPRRPRFLDTHSVWLCLLFLIVGSCSVSCNVYCGKPPIHFLKKVWHYIIDGYSGKTGAEGLLRGNFSVHAAISCIIFYGKSSITEIMPEIILCLGTAARGGWRLCSTATTCWPWLTALTANCWRQQLWMARSTCGTLRRLSSWYVVSDTDS